MYAGTCAVWKILSACIFLKNEAHSHFALSLENQYKEMCFISLAEESRQRSEPVQCTQAQPGLLSRGKQSGTTIKQVAISVLNQK